MLKGAHRRAVLGIIDMLRAADGAGRYRMLTRMYSVWQTGKVGYKQLATLTVHLLLNPHLLAGIIAGVGYEKGMLRRERAWRPSSVKRALGLA